MLLKRSYWFWWFWQLGTKIPSNSDQGLLSISAESDSVGGMFIDLVSLTAWDDLNEKLQKQWGLNERLQCFYGSRQAVYETTQSLTQFMTHKKSVGLITGLSPHFHDQLPYYFREGIEVQKRSFSDSSPLQEWVDALNKDTNFVVFAVDHPITGEIFKQADELEALLNAKRIFAVKIYHRPRQTLDPVCSPYSVHIHAYGPDRAVVITGARYRAPHLVSHLMSWREEDFLSLSVEIPREERVEVESFESEFANYETVSLLKSERRYDRLVISFKDINADALLSKLEPHLGLLRSDVFTTSLCQWGSPKTFKGWWETLPSDEVLRGLCVFSLDVLQTKNFANILKTSYEELRAEQSWVV